MRLAGHTLGTPDHTVPQALKLFRAAGLDAAEVIYQDGYTSGLPLGDRRAAPGGTEGGRKRRPADRWPHALHDGHQLP